MTISSARGAISILSRSFASSTSSAGATALNSSAIAQNINNIITNGQVTQQKNQYIASITNRVTALVNGQITASEDWEKVAVYAARQGIPLSIGLDSKNQKEVTAQDESSLTKFSDPQKKRLQAAIADLSDLVTKQASNLKSESLVAKLQTAADTVQYVQSGGAIDPTQTWQLGIRGLRDNYTPFKVSLDSKGNETLVDQTSPLYPLTLPSDKQQPFQQIMGEWQQAVADGVYLKDWQVKAKSIMDVGHSVYFELDAGNNVVVKENTAGNVVPDFMKKDPYPDLTKNLPKWQTDALAFAAAGKPYFLDIDQSTQQIVAKEATSQNVVQYNTDPAYKQAMNGTAAILSLLA